MTTTSLLALWLPIVVATVIVFIASSIIHMAPLWHRNAYPPVPDEDGVRGALKPFRIPPGDYMLPRARSGAEMRTPEFTKKMEEGPVLVLTSIAPGPVSMGRSLMLWFLYVLAVSFVSAYVAGRALPPGAHYLDVFRFAGTAAFLAYAGALWQMSIWFHRAWRSTFTGTLDGLIYALLTAGTFGWLWPK
ncbi:MAG TPA: hypothetical protein VGF48_21405 [Thermoanaerobaculia bacterium]|jgi:hypothetical protein